jgi:hypothetical protein
VSTPTPFSVAATWSQPATTTLYQSRVAYRLAVSKLTCTRWPSCVFSDHAKPNES